MSVHSVSRSSFVAGNRYFVVPVAVWRSPAPLDTHKRGEHLCVHSLAVSSPSSRKLNRQQRRVGHHGLFGQRWCCCRSRLLTTARQLCPTDRVEKMGTLSTLFCEASIDAPTRRQQQQQQQSRGTQRNGRERNETRRDETRRDDTIQSAPVGPLTFTVSQRPQCLDRLTDRPDLVFASFADYTAQCTTTQKTTQGNLTQHNTTQFNTTQLNAAHHITMGRAKATSKAAAARRKAKQKKKTPTKQPLKSNVSSVDRIKARGCRHRCCRCCRRLSSRGW